MLRYHPYFWYAIDSSNKYITFVCYSLLESSNQNYTVDIVLLVFSIICLNFWDEAWWFLSLRVFGLLSSSLLLFPQCFGRYVLRPSSGFCRQKSENPCFQKNITFILISKYVSVLSIQYPFPWTRKKERKIKDETLNRKQNNASKKKKKEEISRKETDMKKEKEFLKWLARINDLK